jgi:hypothetical protein
MNGIVISVPVIFTRAIPGNCYPNRTKTEFFGFFFICFLTSTHKMVKKLPRGATQTYIDDIKSLQFDVCIKMKLVCTYFFVQNEVLSSLLSHYTQLYLDNPLRQQLLSALFGAIGNRKVLFTLLFARSKLYHITTPRAFTLFSCCINSRHMAGYGVHTVSQRQALRQSKSFMSFC